MPKPSEVILKVLKDNGVELTREIELSIKSDLDEHSEIAIADKVLGEGQVAVDEATRRQERDDIAKLRKRMHQAENRAKDLEDSLNAGESQLKRENELLKEKIKKMEPQFNDLMDSQRTRWKGLAEKIPEKVQEKFLWPEGETEVLTDAQVLSNLKKYDEYASLGVEGFAQAQAGEQEEGGEPPSFPKGSPTGKTGAKAKEDISDIEDPSTLLKMGYEKVTKASSGEKD